ENSSMKQRFWLVAAASLLAPVALAQAPEPDPPEEEIRQARIDPDRGDVAQEDLETFADIYLDLERMSARYENRLAAVGSEEEARELQVELQRETRRKVEDHGWTTERYEAVLQAVNSNPSLLQRALELMDDR